MIDVVDNIGPIEWAPYTPGPGEVSERESYILGLGPYRIWAIQRDGLETWETSITYQDEGQTVVAFHHELLPTKKAAQALGMTGLRTLLAHMVNDIGEALAPEERL